MLDFLEADLLCALPQHGLAERGQVLQPRGQGDEVVAGELTHLACEMHAAIGQQDFGLADAAGIENDLAGCGIAGVVLVGDAEIEIAERHPDTLAAPADMDRLALERHRLAKRRHRLRRQLLLEAGLEGEFTGSDNQLAHRSLLLDVAEDVVQPYPLQPEHAEARTIPASREVSTRGIGTGICPSAGLSYGPAPGPAGAAHRHARRRRRSRRSGAIPSRVRAGTLPASLGE